MTDFLNKLVEVILVFILLVLAPITISYMTTEMVTQRTALNEVSQFIDRVTDKQMITKADVDDLYLALSATGGMYDITVKRYVPVSTPTIEGGKTVVKSTYVSVDDIDNISDAQPVQLNVSDVVKVTVNEVVMSQGKKMLWAVLKLDSGKLNFSLAGSVR